MANMLILLSFLANTSAAIFGRLHRAPIQRSVATIAAA